LTIGACACLIRAFPPNGQVAQLVEQRTENPRVGGSIPSLATNEINISNQEVASERMDSSSNY
jgi:hypothetical protein